jgi:hypothetical protein
LTLAPSPIVNAEITNWQSARLLKRLLSNPTPNRIVTDRDGQSIEESLARKAAGHIADESDDF